MNERLTVGIIGDQFPEYRSAQQVAVAMIERAAEELDVNLRISWLATPMLAETDIEARLERMDALWCSPGSPYLSLEGALNGIRFARECERPFIGTCAGFQHAVLEYARNVMGIADAASEEYDAKPLTSRFITALACPVATKTLNINLLPGSRAFKVYGKELIEEYYYCQFGLNPAFQRDVDESGFKVVGTDENGEARVLELPNHRFFIATLFVPGASFTERSIEMKNAHPLVKALLEAGLSSQKERIANRQEMSTVV
jgi:CTP synthase (UTP-ammonia lyase)